MQGIMERVTFGLKQPKRKRRVYSSKHPPLPVPIESISNSAASVTNWNYYTGYVCDRRVIVQHTGDMDSLYKNGFFGKGTLSRSEPEYNHGFSGIKRMSDSTGLRYMSKRRYLAHLHWQKMKHSTPTCDEPFEYDLPISRDNGQTNSLPHVMIDRTNIDADNPVIVPSLDNYCDTSNNTKVKRSDEDKDNDEWPGSRNDSASFGMLPDASESSTKDEDATSGHEAAQSHDTWSTDTTNFWADLPICNPDVKSVGTDTAANESTSEVVLTKTSSNTVSIMDERTNETTKQHNNSLSESMKVNTSDDNTLVLTEYKPISNNPKSTRSQSSDAPEIVSDTAAQHLSCSQLKISCDQTTDSDKIGVDARCLPDEQGGDLYVVDDSDFSDDEKLEVVHKTKWRPCVKKDPAPVLENLQLMLEEAFFLSYGLGCLIVLNEHQCAMDLLSLWQHCCSNDACFVQNYAVYHHLRSKGWVPRSGLKFGCQFVVYKEGPPFYHSSYSVLVRLVSSVCPEHLTWPMLAGFNRVTETVSKEVMICYVVKPDNMTEQELESPKCLSRLCIQEVIVKRWISNQERQNTSSVLLP